MEEIDPTIFADVADAFGIKEPVLVEKDYYAVQLLKWLYSICDSSYSLVFSGGTSLSKAHINTFRMSEDVDIKIIPSLDIQKKSRSAQRKLRGQFYQKLRDLLEDHETFKLIESQKLDEGKFLQYSIEYPRYHQLIDAIRPVIQLEITESTLFEPPIVKPISSMHGEALQLSPELSQCPCATIEITASEKFVSLLRRTAAYARDNEKKDDETLIRHIYDLHLINQSNADMTKISRFVEQVIKVDMEEFGNQHPQFRDDPYKELSYGFKLLQEDNKHKDRILIFGQTPIRLLC